MNYPLISEYIEAIKSAEDNFEELTILRPVLDDDGQPVMTSGNFAVVFKMEDMKMGKFYALKCFTKEQEGRAEAYHQIADALKNVDSPYLVSLRYFDKELFVDTEQTTETDFPVLLMDWVEGKTLDKYLRENLDDKYTLEMLAYRFSQLAQWLIPQPYAHGDLKPDNILVREDGTLVLVDYDGMYVPAMKGQKARELGSPDFRHPLRTEDNFDEHIDDFPLICISLSLKAITINTNLLLEVNNDNGLLFTTSDYIDLANSKLVKVLCNLAGDTDYYRLLGGFFICTSNKTFYDISHKLFKIQEPKQKSTNYGFFIDPRDGYSYKTIKIGNQTWLAENLRYLPQIGNGYYVYNYHGNNVNEAKETQNYIDYGVLYDIAAAQEACPQGWHIPSDEEWKNLELYIGMPIDEVDLVEDNGMDTTVPYRGKRIGSALLDINSKYKQGPLIEQKNTDFGFDARLAGWRNYFGHFESIYKICRWWTTRIITKVDGSAYDYDFYTYRELFCANSGIGNGYCAQSCCLSLRCIKDNSLPFPEIPYKEMAFIPYPEPKESVKKKIRQQFLRVEKDLYYSYFAIINTMICEESNRYSSLVRSSWIPSEIINHLNVKMVLNGKNVECTYSQNGVVSSFIQECNTRNIEDVVELSYEIFYRLGLIGYFISNGADAINKINEMKVLNDRTDDLPF